MQPRIDYLARPDQVVRQTRGAHRAENSIRVRGSGDKPIPATSSCGGIRPRSDISDRAAARCWPGAKACSDSSAEIERESSRAFRQDLLDGAEFLHEHAGADQALLMGDEAVHFDGVAKCSRARCVRQLFHRAQLRPAIEGRVELHGVEGRGVMLEPGIGAFGVGIKNSAPMPVKPA